MSLATDDQGNLISQARYTPYGQVRWDGGTLMPTKFAFTGQRQDGFGLMDYNARFYSQKMGRFISADSILSDAFDPRYFDRYSYVRNNPIRRVDMSGHLDCDAPHVAPGDCVPPGSTPDHIYSVLLSVDTLVILDANGNFVNSQFGIDDKTYTGTNGTCGTVCAAAATGIPANTIIFVIDNNAITNWSDTGELDTIFTTFGWETRGESANLALSGSSEERRAILREYISQGWYPLVRVWVTPEGVWIENTGQYLHLIPPRDGQPGHYESGGHNVSAHWVMVLGISNDGQWVRIDDPIRGVVDITWDEFYNNTAIRWEAGDGRIYSNSILLLARPKKHPPILTPPPVGTYLYD